MVDARSNRFDVLETVPRKTLKESDVVRLGNLDVTVLYNGTDAAFVKPLYVNGQSAFLSVDPVKKVTIEEIG